MENVMSNNEQKNDITELQPEDTKAVVGGATAVEYALIAAGVAKEIIAGVQAIPAGSVSSAAANLQKLLIK
jgi:hypothetical protein